MNITPVIPTDTNEESFEVWVCVDCYAYQQNNTAPQHLHTEEQLAHWLNDVLVGLSGGYVTPGKNHDSYCCENVEGEGDHTSCETTDFSSTSCDLCMSHLGGSRHAMTLWVEIQDSYDDDLYEEV